MMSQYPKTKSGNLQKLSQAPHSYEVTTEYGQVLRKHIRCDDPSPNKEIDGEDMHFRLQEHYTSDSPVHSWKTLLNRLKPAPCYLDGNLFTVKRHYT